MDFPWTKKESDVLAGLGTQNEGLSTSVAHKRLLQDGKNAITKKRDFAALRILIGQLRSPLIYILFFAMVISYFMHSTLDAYVIFGIIVINTGIGFFQQYRAENLIANLTQYMVPRATVRRGGKLIVINSTELVVGDIVVLREGEKVSSDMRILSTDGLEVNEAVLTGESMSVLKQTKPVSGKTVSLHKQTNMLFAGTSVVRGSCEGVVIATGDHTAFGKLATELQSIKTGKTPMQKKIEKLSLRIGAVILLLVGLIFGLGILRSDGYGELFLISITLAVGAIPEGLPAVMAVAFSVSSSLMAKKNVVIRRLPAVESLGSVTVICTDKTGTLTQEKMVVQKLFSGSVVYEKRGVELFSDSKKIRRLGNSELDLLFRTSVLSSDARFEKEKKGYSFLGDPTEIALIRNGLDLGVNRATLTEKYPRLETFSFDGERKYMSILRKASRGRTLYTKGAPERVLAICKSEMINGKVKSLTARRRKQLLAQVRNMEKEALRNLGFAYRDFSMKEEVAEKDLIFIGFIGMIDPPREDVADAIARAQSAGIAVKMITGDSLLTAQAISSQIGITGTAIDSKTLDDMSDSALFLRINEISIFARATPSQKLRVLKALQAKGHTVAMTGDGVNDVLALKSADVGISMGIRGTDVARDVSDIVLLDDNFSSIVNGVSYGRVTYDNIKKFTKYMLAVNFSTIFLVTLTTLFASPLPILPLQILWKNIITDSFPAISLIFEKGEDVMKSLPRTDKHILTGTYRFLATGASLNFLAAGGVYLYGLLSGYSLGVIQTMVVMTGIIFELLFIYSARSEKKMSEIGWFSNKVLNWAILLAFSLNFLLVFTPLGSLFHILALTSWQWMIVILASLSGIIIYEGTKYIRK
ncbi:MAG: Ca2+-transporting ATPase [Patescibacteria group bacterium]|jgi:Ca2+-transporting ATPase